MSGHAGHHWGCVWWHDRPVGIAGLPQRDDIESWDCKAIVCLHVTVGVRGPVAGAD